MSIQKDFKSFNPRSYLKEYYSQVGKENRELLRFHVLSYSKIFSKNSKAEIIELGCGPTIYQLIAPAKYNVSIDVSDYLEANLNEIRYWLYRKPARFDWNRFIKYTLYLESGENELIHIKKREQEIRNKVRKLYFCDVRSKKPLNVKSTKLYDVVSVHFVPESITSSKKEWEDILINILTLIKPKGYLVLCSIVGASHYRVGNFIFPATSITPRLIKGELQKKGMTLIANSVVTAQNFSQGYDGIFMLLAKKV